MEGTRPAATTALAFLLLLAGLLAVSAQRTGGELVYALDDPYIHLAMAETLALHGTWGIEPGVFVSASSSPLWTLLLAAAVRVVGPGQGWLPGALAATASLGVLVAAHAAWTRAGLAEGAQRLPGIALAAVISLPALCCAGLEHPLHIALALSLLFVVTERPERLPLAAALAGSCALARFEGLFLVAALAVVSALRRRWPVALVITAAGGVAVAGFGLWSLGQGGAFLPNTLLIKGNLPTARPLSVWVFVWAGQLLRAPWLLALLATLILARPHLGPADRDRAHAVILTTLLHVQLAQVGWFFRYEAWLIALAVVTLVAGLGHRLAALRSERALSACAALAALILVGRAAVIAYATPRASADIRHQQVNLARFVGAAFPGETVALHDIGRVAWERKVHVLDLFGLANDTVRAEKLARTLTAARVRELVAGAGAPVAIVYDSWFGPEVTGSWEHVGGWTFPDGWVCPDDTVSVYATNPEDAPRVRAAFAAFAATLGPPVVVRPPRAAGGVAAGSGAAESARIGAGTPAEGFPGTWVYTPAQPAGAAVVVLHGSEGGRALYAPALAAALAEEGLTAAAFCWFGCEGSPDRVQRVSLDRTVAFLEWFEAGPATGQPVVLYGASRGAEHALLLGSLLGDSTRIAGIASHAGTDTVVAAYDPAARGPVLVDGGYDAAWTWQGTPMFGERALPFGSGPRIAIERYPGPVWLSHGEVDRLWPADRTRRLAAARGALPTETHLWPGEDHVVQSPENVRALLASLVAFARARASAPPEPPPPAAVPREERPEAGDPPTVGPP